MRSQVCCHGTTCRKESYVKQDTVHSDRFNWTWIQRDIVRESDTSSQQGSEFSKGYFFFSWSKLSDSENHHISVYGGSLNMVVLSGKCYNKCFYGKYTSGGYSHARVLSRVRVREQVENWLKVCAVSPSFLPPTPLHEKIQILLFITLDKTKTHGNT